MLGGEVTASGDVYLVLPVERGLPEKFSEAGDQLPFTDVACIPAWLNWERAAATSSGLL